MVVVVGSACQCHLLSYAVLILGGLAAIEGDKCCGLSQFEFVAHQFHFLLSDLRTIVKSPPRIVVGEDDRPFLYIQNVAAEGVKTILDIFLQRVDGGAHGDHAQDTDGDAREGEKGPQFCRAQLLKGEAQTLRKYLE